MIVPNIPNDRKIIDSDGMITEVWASFFSNLITQLNLNFSVEGYALPTQSAANILLLDTNKSKSRIIWNKDTEKAMVNNDGTFKEIVTL